MFYFAKIIIFKNLSSTSNRSGLCVRQVPCDSEWIIWLELILSCKYQFLCDLISFGLFLDTHICVHTESDFYLWRDEIMYKVNDMTRHPVWGRDRVRASREDAQRVLCKFKIFNFSDIFASRQPISVWGLIRCCRAHSGHQSEPTGCQSGQWSASGSAGNAKLSCTTSAVRSYTGWGT